MKKLLMFLFAIAFSGITWGQVSAYSFASSIGTYNEITGGTVVVTATSASGAGSLDDINYTLPAATIPFNFTFNGTAYTGLVINTNGYITFGATTPSTSGYTPISATTAYSGAIAAIGRDLNSLYNISGNTGQIRYETVGTAPNREFVIQYKNFRPYSTSTSTTTYYRWNFQIRLKEDNSISIIYNFNFVGSPSVTTPTAQVGLRGATNSNYHNRTTTTNWSATTSGVSNSATCSFSTTVLPASGLTYTFTPPNPCTTPLDQPTNLVFSNITSTTLTGTYTAASGSDSYLVVRSTSNTHDTPPVDGTAYTAGTTLGNGTVAYAGSALTFNATGLTSSTKYYYFVYSMNSFCSGGPLYLTSSSPLSLDVTTGPSAPLGFTAAAVSSSEISITATPNATDDWVLIAWNSTNTFGNPSGIYNVGDPLAGGGEILYYGKAATAPNHTGLTPATTYYYKIWSELNTLYSSALTTNATTLCLNVSTFPFTESFDGSTFAPNCWTNIKTAGTGTPGIWDKQTTGSNPTCNTHSGAAMARFNCYSLAVGTKGELSTPAIDFPNDNHRVKFWFYRDASAYPTNADLINVYYNTTSTSSGGTLLGTINRSTTLAPVVPSQGWYEYSYNMPIGSAGSGRYIIFEAVSAYGNNLFLDDVTIEAIPSCVEPSTLAANTITNNSATATWVAGATETLWNLEYGVAGFTQGAGTLVNDLSSTTYNFTSLTGNTNYSFYVQSNCGSSTSPWSGPYTFKTLCDAVSIPITQNFDGVTTPNLPDCWTKKVVSTSSAALTTSTTYHSASNGVYFSNSGDAASQLFLISPKIVENLNTLRVKLWAYSYSTYSVKVGVMTDPTDAATFVEIASYPTSSTWTERITDLNSYSGSATYIAIKFVGTGTYQSIYVDDISIDLLPSCLEPTALNATSVTSNSATINWTASASIPTNGYEYEVRTSEAAGSGATGLVTSGTTAAGIVTANISSLTANTTYSFYVRSNCGSTYSSWTSAGSFFTGYCNPSATSVDGTGITNVTFGVSPNVVNNTTANETNNYGNYSVQIGDLQRGTVSSLAITFNTSTYDYNTKIWIDFNDDLDFADMGEEVYSGLSAMTSPNTLNTTFIIPLSVSLGNHRLRIGAGDNSAPSSCAVGLTYTCFEDYTVNVLEAPSCLAPNTLLATPAAFTADLSWTEAGTATSWDIEWGTTGFTPTGTPTITGVTNPYTLNGLAQSTAYAYYVRANCGGSNSTWTGPKTFTTTVACPAPTALTTNSTTTTTANLSWTSTATAFEIEYGVAPYTFTGTANVTNILASNKELTGLQTATTYQYKVKAICGGANGESLWSSIGTFTTSALPYSLPFTEEFTSTSQLPIGWSLWQSSGTGYSWTASSSGFTSGCAYSGYYGTIWLKSREITVPAGGTVRLNFYQKNTYVSDYLKHGVYYSTTGSNNISDWTAINADLGVAPTSWTKTSDFIISGYSGTKIYLAFKYEGSNADGWYIDNVHMEIPQAGLWTGTTNNDWSTATNWDNGIVPNATSNVTIPATAPNFPTLTSAVTLNNLTIESNASGTGSLLDNGNLTINGIATVKQYIAADKWHFISSPVSSATTNVFSPALNSNIPIYIRNWNQASQTWEDIINLTTYLTVGKGYAIWATASSPTIVYNGSLNNTSSITYSNGWNLISNPFVSAIDWNAASLTGKPLSGYYYYWNSANASFTSTNGALSTNLPATASANIITAMQGFFIYSTNAGALGGLSGARTHNNHPLYKNTNTLNDVIRITAQRGVYKDEALFAYNSLSLNGFNESYDARKLFANNNNIPELYTVTNSKDVAIKSFGNYPASFPLNIRMGVADNVTLTASEFANFDASVNITLEDMLTGTTQDLRQNPSYSFAASIGENANRFVLHFATASGINSPNAGNISIYANENTIYVNTTEKVKEISVYNMLGQVITSVSGNAKSLQTISIDNASGNYVVKVTTEKGVKTEKVFVK